MRAFFLLAALALAACATDDSDEVTVEGVDPVETDADLAPDPTLQPEPSLAPEADLTPEPDLAPDPTVQPDSSGMPE